MSRFRLIILGLFTMLVLNAVASTSASAALCEKKPNGNFVLCEGEPLLLVEGNLILFILPDPEDPPITLTNAAVKITCTLVHNENSAKELVGTLDGLATAVHVLKLVLAFSMCKANANCEVEEPIFTLELEGLVDGKELILFYPAANGTHFATLTLKGVKCLVAGKVKVTTENNEAKKGPLCDAADIEKTKELHLILCLATKSHLLFGGKAAEFEGPFDVKLLLADKKTFDLWDVIEGV